ncbi:hypothetical protein K5D65_15255 [Pseudomonas cichorii]|nr:hypothetical protein [Pseudomonas cichorii]
MDKSFSHPIRIRGGCAKGAEGEAATLNQKALALERWRLALENRELEVEQRLDRLGDIDAALSLALRDAERESLIDPN